MNGIENDTSINSTLARGVFTELFHSNDMGIQNQTQRHMRTTDILLLWVSVAAGTRLPSRCLEMNGEMHITEPLPSNDRKDTYADTQTEERQS
jgi:hypothetical protein